MVKSRSPNIEKQRGFVFAKKIIKKNYDLKSKEKLRFFEIFGYFDHFGNVLNFYGFLWIL